MGQEGAASGGRFALHRCEKTLTERTGDVRPAFGLPRAQAQSGAGAHAVRAEQGPAGRQAGDETNGTEREETRWKNGSAKDTEADEPGKGPVNHERGRYMPERTIGYGP